MKKFFSIFLFSLPLLATTQAIGNEVRLECKGVVNIRYHRGNDVNIDEIHYINFDDKKKIVPSISVKLMDCYSGELSKYYNEEKCDCQVSERYISCNSKIVIKDSKDYWRESNFSLDRYSGKLNFYKRFWGNAPITKEYEDIVETSIMTCNALSKKF